MIDRLVLPVIADLGDPYPKEAEADPAEGGGHEAADGALPRAHPTTHPAVGDGGEHWKYTKIGKKHGKKNFFKG